MHEAGLMEAALELAAQQARQAGASQILRLRLRVGVLSGVVPDALRFAFEALSPGTAAENSQLEIIPVPATAWCSTCQEEFETMEIAQECPRCHAFSTDIRGGCDLELDSLEVQ